LRIRKNALPGGSIAKCLDRAAKGRLISSAAQSAYQFCLSIKGGYHEGTGSTRFGDCGRGIDRIFAVIGDANQEIIVELCEKHGLKFVTHHETAAVGMADGYARLSGKIGLAATTQGPGYTNATTSLVSARLHRSPVLMLAGHASLRDPYNPQGMLDQHAMAKLTTGATVKIDHARNVDYCPMSPLGSATKVATGAPRYSANLRTSGSALPSAAPSPQRIVGRLALAKILAASATSSGRGGCKIFALYTKPGQILISPRVPMAVEDAVEVDPVWRVCA